MPGDENKTAESPKIRNTVDFKGIPLTKVYAQEILDIVKTSFGDQSVLIFTVANLNDPKAKEQFFMAMTSDAEFGFAFSSKYEDGAMVKEIITRLGGTILEGKA